MDNQLLASLRDEVRTMSIRLSFIEDRLNSEISRTPKEPEAPSHQVPQSQIQNKIATPPTSQKPQLSHPPRPAVTIPIVSASGPSATSQFLAVVGVCCFVLAASFLIKLAIDAGWLTPERQMAMATLFGFALIGTGLKFRDYDARYFSFLPGAGIVILFLSVYGGGMFYKIYTLHETIFLAGGVSCLSLYLFGKLRQEFYTLTAILGTYLVPLLLPTFRADLVELASFFIIWDVIFSVFAILARSRLILIVNGYIALLVFAAMDNNSDLSRIAVFQAIQFCVFATGIGIYSVKNRQPLTKDEAWICFPFLLFFYGLEYSYLSRLVPSLAPWVSMGFAGLVYGIYFLSKSALQTSLNSGAMVSSFVAVVLFHSFYLNILPSSVLPWFGVALLLALPWLLRHLDLIERNFIPGLCVLAVIGIEFLKIILGDGSHPLGEWALLGLIYSILFLTLYARGRGARKFSSGDLFSGILILADIQALTALYRFAEIFSRNLNLFSYAQFVVSLFWGIFALAVLSWAKFKSDRILAQSSLFVLGVSAFKVLLVDVSSANPVLRIVCLLLLGIVLYFGGFMLRNIQTWKTQ